jgi:hypothetical protein
MHAIYPDAQTMGRYFRHPASVLIEVTTRGQPEQATHNTLNLSVGGLAFRCDREFEHGSFVEICIPNLSPPFRVEARIAWSRAHGGHFETGAEFLHQDDAYTARMVEQVCHIENYKQEILRTEGRSLSQEEAAKEWIHKYASRFPGSAETH